MNANLFPIIAVSLLALTQEVLLAQDTPNSDATKKPPQKSIPSQQELEATFKATLTKATFKGRWCAIKDGQLGPEKEDKYSIRSVTKIGADMWLINARIQYGK